MNSGLSPKQLNVLGALISGASVSKAAESAGVDRTTVYEWQRQPGFQDALRRCLVERSNTMREAIIGLGEEALQTLKAMLSDQSVSAATRLKAALKVLDTATAPPAPERQRQRSPARPSDEEQFDRMFEAGYLAACRIQIPQNPTKSHTFLEPEAATDREQETSGS